MINPLWACLWGLWLCYPQRSYSYFVTRSSHQWCADSPPLGAVKRSWRMAYWSVVLDIPSLAGDKILCLTKSGLPEKTEEGVETCGCCVFVCHQDLELKNLKHWPTWITNSREKDGAVSRVWIILNCEAQVTNMDNLRNNKNPWVQYEKEVPHSRFW